MRKLSIVLALIAATFAATSFALWRELVLEQQHSDALESRLEQLHMGSFAPSASGDMSESLTDLEASPGARPVLATPSAAMPERVPDEVDANPGSALRRPPGSTDASYRDARREVRRLELANRHRDLAKVLGIAPQTADQLLDILAEGEADFRRSRGNAAEAEARIAAQQDAIRGLLGEAGLAAWQNYQASMPSRFQVNQLRSTTSGGLDPLREDQVEPLIAAMHLEQQRFRDEMEQYRATVSVSPGDEQQAREQENARTIAGLTATSQRIHSAAAPILSSTQLKALDEQLTRQIQMREARSRMNRARNDARSTDRN